MEFVKLLLSDDAERAHFAVDPGGTLSEHGLGDLSPADVHDAVVLVQDTLTVDWAQAPRTRRPPRRASPRVRRTGGPPSHPIRWSSTPTRACPRPPPQSTTRSSTPLTCTSGTEPLSHAP